MISICFHKDKSVTFSCWMVHFEHEQMISSGKVVQSSTGTTHVASPADIEAFWKNRLSLELFM